MIAFNSGFGAMSSTLYQVFKADFLRAGKRNMMSEYEPFWYTIYALMHTLRTNGEIESLYVHPEQYQGARLVMAQPPAGQMFHLVAKLGNSWEVFIDAWQGLDKLPSNKIQQPADVMRSVLDLKGCELLTSDICNFVKVGCDRIVSIYHSETIGECWLMLQGPTDEHSLRLSWRKLVHA